MNDTLSTKNICTTNLVYIKNSREERWWWEAECNPDVNHQTIVELEITKNKVSGKITLLIGLFSPKGSAKLLEEKLYGAGAVITIPLEYLDFIENYSCTIIANKVTVELMHLIMDELKANNAPKTMIVQYQNTVGCTPFCQLSTIRFSLFFSGWIRESEEETHINLNNDVKQKMMGFCERSPHY